MAKLKIEALIAGLGAKLEEKFVGEQFLREELEAVLQGLVNSIRFSAIRFLERTNSIHVDYLVISRDFSNESMKLSEIVDRIQNTSGLSKEMASYALTVIGETIEIEVKRERELDVEHIGRIKLLDQRYNLELSEELRVHPPYSYEIPWKAIPA